MEFNRKYLKSEEIDIIVQEMLNKETSIEREVVKIALVSQYLMSDNLFKDCETANDIYDLVLSEIDMDDFEMINNYYIIDKVYQDEISTYHGTRKLFNKMASWFEETRQRIVESYKKLNKEDKEKVDNLLKRFKEEM